MKRHLLYALCLTMLPMIFPRISTAQGPITGTPRFGSFGGGPDVINLGNLNVHWDIPIMNKPGRAGMNFKYDATYDSSIWAPVTSGGTQVWTLVAPLTAVMGWQGPTAAQPGSITYSAWSQSGGGPGVSCTFFGYNNFTYWDSFGNQHAFNFNGAMGWQYGCSGSGSSGPSPALPWTSNAADGSGYVLTITPSSPGMDEAPTLAATLVGSNGNTIGAPLVNQPPPPSAPVIAEDRNGNQISFNSSTSVFTDTLNTPVLTVSGAAPNNTTLSYTAPGAQSASYTVKYITRMIQTKFLCNGINEYGPISNNLISEIDLPDISVNPNDKYTFAYETTPGDSHNPPYVTGRLTGMTLPTGGTVTYTYTGGSNGIVCADGSTAGLTRTLSPGGMWTYTRTGSSNTWATTVTDPASNQTLISFQKDSGSQPGNNLQNFYETQRLAYQGSTSGTLLLTTNTCYNGSASPCTSTAVASPITQAAVVSILPGANNLQSKQVNSYDTYGSVTETDAYDYGNNVVGALIRKTLTTYSSLTGINGTFEAPLTVEVKDGNNNRVAYTSNGYDQTAVTATTGTPQLVSVPSSDSRGNLTSVATQANGTTTLNRSFTYYDTGTINVATDVNNAQTTYHYDSGSCGNSFVTSVGEPLSLSRSMTWNCTGGVMTSLTDENGNISSTSYTTDPYFWRPESSKDQAGNVTTFTYPNQNQVESVLPVTSGSVSDILTTEDTFGRTIFTQTRQGPAPGITTFDSVATCHDNLGRAYFVSLPYSAAAATWSTSCPSSSPGTTTTSYDALSRPLTVTDSGGGTISYSYTANDVLQALGPAPPSENPKRKQTEYDGLGRLKSVCEITGGTGSGTCGQNSSQPGYWTEYTYDPLGNMTGVTQNAQGSPQQTRSYAYDMLSRLTSETNPETGTKNYTYDSDGTCGTSSGDQVKRVDAAGNSTCYTYDQLHRVLSTTYGGPNATANKYFVYDAATVNGVSMGYAKGRMAEAYTGSPSSKTTDLGFVYSPRGENLEAWESTPNSGGYYHPTTGSSYWANGGLETLWMSGLPTITYGVDGEGRTSSVSASSGQNPVTATSYNAASQVTGVTFGSGDSDAPTYDSNTGRMTQYKFNVNGSVQTGNLGWNANSTLHTLGITDPFNAANAQNCSYGYDDLSRLASVGCGSTWAQTFAYDAFGNASKSGSSSWQPNYNTKNQYSSIPGFPNPGPTYDANGDLLTDSFNNYTWDAEGHVTAIGAIGLTYDALGRQVEQNQNGTYFQIVYSPVGTKLAVMKGQTIQQAFVPLPGGATAEYLSWGLSHYRHPDWLGSSRLESNTGRAILQDTGYAPFGEPYAELSGGNGEISFTGQNKDTDWLNYDFMYREYDPRQGRWISPDPAGLGVANPADPQSWNRYAYVGNNPLSNVDPTGLCSEYGGVGVDACPWMFEGGLDLGGVCEGCSFNSDIPFPRAPLTPVIETILPGENSINYPIGNSNPVASIWQDALGLPTLPCQSQFGPWCDASMLPNPWIMDQGPAANNPTPNNKPSFWSCTFSAGPGAALGTTALDAIGIIPGGGNVLHGVQLVAGGGALALSLGRASFNEAAAGGATTGLAFADAAGETTNIAIHGVEIVPVLGNIVSAGATVNDIFGKDGVISSYKACLSGGH